MLNPAVRGVTDWNMLGSSFCTASYWPSVAGLLHSSTSTDTVPTTSSTAVPTSIILAWTDRCRAPRNLSWNSSSQTGKPSPPATISVITTRLIGQSSTNGDRFVGSSPKPALLNADTEWNRPYQNAFQAG